MVGTLSLSFSLGTVLLLWGGWWHGLNPGSRGTMVSAQIEIALGQAGYSFYADINFQSHLQRDQQFTKTAIIDTANDMFVMQNSTLFQQPSGNYVSPPIMECMLLYEDLSDIDYNGYFDVIGDPTLFDSCTLQTEKAFMQGSENPPQTAESVLNVTIASYFYIANQKLHNWSDIDGDMGLGYCNVLSSSCQLTAFQLLLLNATNNSDINVINYERAADSTLLPTSSSVIFGLDLNIDISIHDKAAVSMDSTLQLGYIDPTFNDTMVWYEQATTSPVYHVLFVEDLDVCGVNLMGNWASNWPAIVDSGQVCLQLPDEFYSAFIGWFDTTAAISDAGELPTLSFTVSSSSPLSNNPLAATTFFLPLEDLILNYGDFIGHEDALNITVGNSTKSLCVLQSGRISAGKYDESYETPAIIFGTLALKSFYFAADFTSGSVGLASKLNSSQVLKYHNGGSSKYCRTSVECRGQQVYEYDTNTCQSPSCKNYFFTYVDPTTQTCQYNKAYGWGVFIVSLIVAMEVASFFAVQQTTAEFVRDHFGSGEPSQLDRVMPTDGEIDLGTGTRSAPSIVYKQDLVSSYIGPVVTKLLDVIVVRLLGWSRGQQA
jgi:hypothetical protein